MCFYLLIQSVLWKQVTVTVSVWQGFIRQTFWNHIFIVNAFSPPQDRCSSECSNCCSNVSVCDECYRLGQMCDCRLPTMGSCLSNSCPSSTVSNTQTIFHLSSFHHMYPKWNPMYMKLMSFLKVLSFHYLQGDF